MKYNALQDAAVYEPVLGEEISDEKRCVLEAVGEGKDVLEVGANAGIFTLWLKAQGCRTTAVEIDPLSAEKARHRADRVICGDIESDETWLKVGGPFDVILFMHILEHLGDPWSVLSEAARRLRADGRIIVLLPNVACWRVRKDLFFKGAFRYEETGVLDRTHLRFFSLDSARELISSAGLEIVGWKPIDTCVPLERRISRTPGLRYVSKSWHRFLARRFPNLCSEIFYFECSLASN